MRVFFTCEFSNYLSSVFFKERLEQKYMTFKTKQNVSNDAKL